MADPSSALCSLILSCGSASNSLPATELKKSLDTSVTSAPVSTTASTLHPSESVADSAAADQQATEIEQLRKQLEEANLQIRDKDNRLAAADADHHNFRNRWRQLYRTETGNLLKLPKQQTMPGMYFRS